MASRDILSSRLRERVDAVLLLAGWRRLGLAMLAGALAAAALPPVDVFPVYALSFPVLVLLLDSVHGEGRRLLLSLRDAALVGWGFGFGYFVAGLWWLGAAFIAGGDQFLWLMPLGVLGLPAVLALFPAAGLALARLGWHAGPTRILLLAAGLGAAEWLRGILFTGFPWNGFGQAFANHLILAQIVSVIGTEALGPVLVAIFATPVLLATGGGPARFVLPGLAAAILTGMALFGVARLEPVGGTRVDFERLPLLPGVKIRIMQPNIPQDARLALPDGDALLARFFALSDRAKGAHAAGIADVTHLIWPESPFPFVLERNPRAIEAIRRFLSAGTVLVTGAVRAEATGDDARPIRFFNALQVLDRTGIVAGYDKVHLVPFGEFLPAEGLLRRFGLREFVREIGGFTPGAGRRALAVPGLPGVTPLICYEVIFPAEIAGDTGDGPFINVTNDAWFGYTFGPFQHVAQARLRAIEFGRPLIRAANSGVSAVFDPYGRAIAQLPLGIADVLDAPLPASLSGTIQRRWPGFGFATVMILLAVLGLSGRKWR
jgi:apolipoprotein N-acyltransferase